MFLGADAVHVPFFYLGDLTARFRMVLGHQLVLLVFVFLVVLQGALGDDLGVVSRRVLMLYVQIFVLRWIVLFPWSRLDLGSCPLVSCWYV